MSMYDDLSDFDHQDSELEEDSLKDKYLTFEIGDEVFGIEVRYVREIIGIQKITQIPDMPYFIKGVINLRGKVIPVIDVRLRFKMPEIDYGSRTCIIVVSFEESFFGMVVDTVAEVLDIPENFVDYSIRAGGSGTGKYIRGIGKVGDEVKILLSIDKLLTIEELTQIASV